MEAVEGVARAQHADLLDRASALAVKLLARLGAVLAEQNEGRRTMNVRRVVGVWVLGIGLMAARAEAQNVDTAQAIERELHRDGGRLLRVCRETRRVPAMDRAVISDNARALVAWCRAGMVGDPPLEPSTRAIAARQVQHEVARRDALDRVCAASARQRLSTWSVQQQRDAQTPAARDNALRASEARDVIEAVEALGVHCGSPAVRAASREAMSSDRLGQLEAMLRVLESKSTPSPERVALLRDALQSMTGAGSATEALTTGATSAVAPAVNVAAIALEGVAQFLQNRARAEIQVFVVNRIRREVCTAGLSAALLSSTCAFLGRGDDFFAPAFGPSFVAAISDDAVHLPRNLGGYIEERRRAPSTEIPGLQGMLLRASLELLETLSESVDLSRNALAVRNAVARWPCREEPACVETQNAMRLAFDAIDAIAREAATAEPPTRAPQAFVDALNLLAQRLRRGWQIDAAAVDTFYRHAWDVREELRALREARDEAARVARIEPFASSMIALANDAMDIADASRQRPRFPRSLAGFFGALARRSVADSVAQGARVAADVARALSTNGRPVVTIPPDALRLLSFGADLAAARSAEQVSAAIDSFAAPVGSWRLKSRNVFSLWLNGGFGVIGGYEYAYSYRSTGSMLVNGHASGLGQIYAPVGLDFSWGIPGCGNLGIFVPVIDVGALAPINSNVNSDASFNELAFIAPGAYARYGFQHLPFVIGAGVSYRPFARTVTGESGDQSNAALTVGAFLAVDIPIFSFIGIPRRAP